MNSMMQWLSKGIVSLLVTCIFTIRGRCLIDAFSSMLVKRSHSSQRQNLSTLISTILSYPAVIQQLIELLSSWGEQQFAFQPLGITIGPNHISLPLFLEEGISGQRNVHCCCQLNTHGLRLLLKDDVCFRGTAWYSKKIWLSNQTAENSINQKTKQNKGQQPRGTENNRECYFLAEKKLSHNVFSESRKTKRENSSLRRKKETRYGEETQNFYDGM